jgi:hypothetical protein
MKITVIGKTDSTLTLNKCKTYIRGKVEAVVDITTDDQRKELAELESAKLIYVIDDEDNKINANPLKASTRQPTEQERVAMAEAKTQQMGSRVVISNGNGTAEGKMRRSAIGDICDSDRTKESVEALKKIEDEENAEAIEDLVVNDTKLDPSEQMGRKAIVSTGASHKSVKMVNKLSGETEVPKGRDPFIDKKENADRDKLLSKESGPKNISSVPFEDIKDDYVPELSDSDLFMGSDTPPSEPNEDDPFIEV